MITDITGLLSNFRNGRPCVIELDFDDLLYSPIIDIVDIGGLDEEIQDENTDDTYNVHEIHIICGATNVAIKAYWTSDIFYDNSIGKWIISEPK